MSFVHRSVAGDVCGRDLVRQPLPSRLVHVGATADVLLEFAIDIVTPGLQRVEPRFDALDGLPMVLDAGDPQAQVVGHRNQSDSLFRLCSHHLCLVATTVAFAVTASIFDSSSGMRCWKSSTRATNR